jgi:hypothetical protein
MARNRVIYQSEALYVSPNATGYHYVSGTQGTGSLGNLSAGSKMANWTGDGHTGTLVEQLTRVQTANYSFTTNRQDINEYGKLARIDSIVVDPPTVSLDFSYYLTDGRNEYLLDFPINGLVSAASGHLQARAGQNFFIQTAKEGSDAIGLSTGDHGNNSSVIGLGNGFLSDYSVEAAVGSLPTASVTIEGFNMMADTKTIDVDTPGIVLENGQPIKNMKFALPLATGDNDDGGIDKMTSDISALRPGDISVQFKPADGKTWEYSSLLNQVSGAEGVPNVNIQSFNLSLPLSRTPIDRLGNKFAFTRVVDFPVVATLSINALATDLKTGNLAYLMDDTSEHDIRIQMKKPGTDTVAMQFDFKACLLDSENVSSDIGSNKSVDLTYTTQIGGPEDTTHGVFISGIFNGGTQIQKTNNPTRYINKFG